MASAYRKRYNKLTEARVAHIRKLEGRGMKSKTAVMLANAKQNKRLTGEQRKKVATHLKVARTLHKAHGTSNEFKPMNFARVKGVRDIHTRGAWGSRANKKK